MERAYQKDSDHSKESDWPSVPPALSAVEGSVRLVPSTPHTKPTSTSIARISLSNCESRCVF